MAADAEPFDIQGLGVVVVVAVYSVRLGLGTTLLAPLGLSQFSPLYGTTHSIPRPYFFGVPTPRAPPLLSLRHSIPICMAPGHFTDAMAGFARTAKAVSI